MEREIRIRFIGDAKDMKRASQEAKESLKAMEQGANEMARATASSAEKAGSSIRNFAAEIGKLAGVLAGASAAAAAFWKGIAQNAELESIRLGIATIVSANETIKDSTGKQVEGAQKLAVAQGQVAEVFERMKIDAINTTATLPQLAQGFQAALAPAMAMGVSLDDTRKLTVSMVQAMGAMSIPMDQMRSEINAILQANITNDSTLAKNLGITNEMVKSWQQQGVLVDELMDKLKDFTAAGEEAGKTWTGATSTLADNLGKILQITTEESFETLKKQVNDLNNAGFGTDAQQEAAHWGSIINDSLTTALQTAGSIGTLLLQGAGKFREAMDGIRILGAHLGGEQYRGDQFNRLLGTFQVGGLITSGDPNMLSTAAKAALTLAPSDTPASALIGIAEKGGLKGKELQRFKKGLEEIDRQVNAGISGQIDEILNGWQKTIDDALTKAKNRPKVTITPNKAPAPTPKPTKTTRIGTLYGPELPTPDDQIRVTMGAEFGPATSDVAKAYSEIAKNQAIIGTEQDPLVKGMKAYAEWKKDEGQRLQYQIANVADMIGELVADSMNGSLGASATVRRLGGFGGSMLSMANPIAGSVVGTGSGIVASGLDYLERLKATTEAASRGEEVNREALLQGLKNKHRKTFLGMGVGYDEAAVNEELKSYDALQAAKKAEIEATKKAAEAQAQYAAKLAEAENSVSAFGSMSGVSGLRESLGLGKRSASDISNALMMSGAGIGLGMISDATSQGKMLDALQGLLYTQSLGQGNFDPSKTGMITSANSSARNAYDILSGLGVNVSGKSVNELVTLLQGIVIPAMQDLKSITGGTATGSISGAGTDNALTFDAPTVRNLQVTQNISVNTYAVTGDKASFRALVKDIMTEANTVLGQAV